jgi:hypothetical protein
MKRLLTVTAVLEAGIGIGLLAVPSVVAQVLLGATLDTPAALTVARVVGAALLALGLACWLARYDGQSCAARGLVSGMVLYNLGAVVILGLAGLRSQPVGVGLWPAVVLHVTMTAWCITCLLRKPATACGKTE